MVAKWPAPTHVRAVTTLRTGGVSVGIFESLNLAAHVGDDPSSVEENRQRLVGDLELPSEPAWLHQVHGRNVVLVDSSYQEISADGSFTRERGIVCAVLTADCIPLFLTDSVGSFVGLLHVGWRSLVAGLIESGLIAFAVDPGELLVWIGPGIGADAFIVDDDVRQQLVGQFPENKKACSRYGNKWRINLSRIVEQHLRNAGVKWIGNSRMCTAADSKSWFSHRRDGHCGRMASLIWLV